jgi:hypothetical protein
MVTRIALYRYESVVSYCGARFSRYEALVVLNTTLSVTDPISLDFGAANSNQKGSEPASVMLDLEYVMNNKLDMLSCIILQTQYTITRCWKLYVQ